MAGAKEQLRRRRWLIAGVSLFGLATVIGVAALLWRPPGPAPSPPRVYEGRFVPTGSMIEARSLDEATTTLLQDGRVLVAGGVLHDKSLASAELYDPVRGTWELTDPMPRPTRGATATLLADGQVLVAGGENSAAADLYDPRTGTWSPTGAMPATRYTAVAVRLADGRVLVAGGDGPGANGNFSLLATAELYDPTSGTWSSTGSMSTSRSHPAIVALKDGRVLLVGGGTFVGDSMVETFPPSAELYDPRTSTFALTGSMAESHWIPNATLLEDGRVLVAGGTDKSDLGIARAEVFDPATGRFSATGSMTERRKFPATALLADGRVLLAGGNFIGGDYVPTAETYDPRTGTFSATGSMGVRRGGPTLVRLLDGRVLVIGGATKGPGPYYDATGSAEVFQ
jgi:hypothetical protein